MQLYTFKYGMIAISCNLSTCLISQPTLGVHALKELHSKTEVIYSVYTSLQATRASIPVISRSTQLHEVDFLFDLIFSAFGFFRIRVTRLQIVISCRPSYVTYITDEAIDVICVWNTWFITQLVKVMRLMCAGKKKAKGH